MSDAIDKIIILPMTELYEAPRHAASDAKKMARILSEYRAVLRGLSEKELHAAFNYVKAHHRNWQWPLPAEFKIAHNMNKPSPI